MSENIDRLIAQIRLLNGELEAAILKFQNFEHLEAEGRKNEK